MVSEEEIQPNAKFLHPLMVWKTGVDGLYHYFNSSWLEFTGQNSVYRILCDPLGACLLLFAWYGNNFSESNRIPILANAIDSLEESVLSCTSNEPPEIRIRTFIRGGNQVMICITDNGAGITPELQSRLFEPFFTTKPAGKGTGMGLSISYQIVVENHQGELRCISTVGRGAEFIIAIPL